MSNNNTTTSSNQNQMDYMSILFFIVAAVWLLLAFLYTCLIIVFIKVRSSDGYFFGYQYNDIQFGRIYITTRCYIPLGWLLRSYIQFFENNNNDNDDVDDESNNDNNNNTSRNYSLSRQIRDNQRRRRMTRQERREAMEILLLRNNNSRKETTDNCPSFNSFIASVRINISAILNSLKSKSSQSSTDCIKAKTEIEIVGNQNEVSNLGESSNMKKDDIDLTGSVSNNDELSLETNDVSICCICLGEYLEENPTSSMCLAADNNNNNLERHDDIMISPSLSPKYQSICCIHHFHQDCILTWLQRPNKTDCPCCRRTLVPEAHVIQLVQRIRKEKKRKLSKSSSRTVSNKMIVQQQQQSQQQNPTNHNNISSQSLEENTVEV